MLDKKKKQQKELTQEQQQYQKLAKTIEPQRPIVKNCIKAFLVGGLICGFAQVLNIFFIKNFNFTEETVGAPTSAILIILSSLLTGLGIFDHIGQWAGAGTAIPITGFANTMTSAAIEHRSEGYVLGVGGNMFKLSGSVIVFGVFTAFIVAIIKILFMKMGVI
ncbi:stage V sporulation protein AC [Garciella nitratireducens]|uniref:Stage V sporulation protein AC n=1 Tax=Garciella nitratireducens DSM 15102 TaxID=1121911 RepID=A0A1T4MQZ5_9FIRM|nr:stage V sporulation protein AC [Garciella nitratireducens]SJZ69214.1 stage V sporulation protein AC [Garciella nitratireducens DSM 15102]